MGVVSYPCHCSNVPKLHFESSQISPTTTFAAALSKHKSFITIFHGTIVSSIDLLNSSVSSSQTMARQKQRMAVRREPSDLHSQSNGVIHQDGYTEGGNEKTRANGDVKQLVSSISDKREQKQAGFGTLVFCVGGIYASLYVGIILLK
jgi:hypothetical protein